jgi:hypothetical protein
MVTLGDPASGLVHGGQLAAREAVREVVSSGFRPLDALLPAGGVRRGSLIEWLAGEVAGGGAASLACAVACQLGRQADRPGTIVVVDRTGWFHPPAVLPWLGGAPGATRLVVARPAHDDDEIWAIDQALRCAGVAAVLAWPRAAVGPGGCLAAARHRCTQPWTIAMRRWQLAARSSGAVGLFVRPVTARAEPSWAEARIAVAALPGGTLLERRLRLPPVGGVWGAGACGDERATETVLDLTRGVERTGYQGGRQGRAGGVTRAGESRGAACRAS